MAVEVTKLENGITVVTHSMPHLASAALGVWVAAGSRSEAADENGISHLLEHMAFKGTRSRSARAIAEEIESVGGDINAATATEQTSYMVRVLPEGVSVKAAALAEPLGVVLHGINMAGDLTGKNVLVSGSGPIGLLATFAAKHRGASKVTSSDVLDGPLARAKQIGADEVINVTKQPLPEETYDLILECSAAAPAVNGCMKAIKPRGRIVQIGMFPGTPVAVELAALGQKEITWIGTFRFDNEVDEAIEMIAAAPSVADVVTHVIAVDQATEAFDIAKNSEISGKVLVKLDGEVEE